VACNTEAIQLIERIGKMVMTTMKEPEGREMKMSLVKKVITLWHADEDKQINGRKSEKAIARWIPKGERKKRINLKVIRYSHVTAEATMRK